MERTDYLWPDGPVFFYDDSLFKPGTDAFLLGAFAHPKANDTVCDLGSGTGLIGLLLLLLLVYFLLVFLRLVHLLLLLLLLMFLQLGFLLMLQLLLLLPLLRQH